MAATLLGIDRRLCIFILLACFLIFRHVGVVAALIALASLWSGAYWLTKHDSILITVFPQVLLLQKKIYDPGKCNQ